MRLRAKTDANQAEIIKMLRTIPGLSVAITSGAGNGFPDFVVGFRLVNYFFECKDPNQPPSKQQLTHDERLWHENWRGQVHTIRITDDVLQVLGILERKPLKMQPGTTYRLGRKEKSEQPAGRQSPNFPSTAAL